MPKSKESRMNLKSRKRTTKQQLLLARETKWMLRKPNSRLCKKRLLLKKSARSSMSLPHRRFFRKKRTTLRPMDNNSEERFYVSIAQRSKRLVL